MDHAPRELLDIGATAVIRYHQNFSRDRARTVKVTAEPPPPRSRSPSRHGRGINLSSAWSYRQLEQDAAVANSAAVVGRPTRGRASPCAMSNTSWRAIPALVVCVEVGESEALSALIDNQMRVAEAAFNAKISKDDRGPDACCYRSLRLHRSDDRAWWYQAARALLLRSAGSVSLSPAVSGWIAPRPLGRAFPCQRGQGGTAAEGAARHADFRRRVLTTAFADAASRASEINGVLSWSI